MHVGVLKAETTAGDLQQLMLVEKSFGSFGARSRKGHNNSGFARFVIDNHAKALDDVDDSKGHLGNVVEESGSAKVKQRSHCCHVIDKGSLEAVSIRLSMEPVSDSMEKVALDVGSHRKNHELFIHEVLDINNDKQDSKIVQEVSKRLARPRAGGSNSNRADLRHGEEGKSVDGSEELN